MVNPPLTRLSTNGSMCKLRSRKTQDALFCSEQWGGIMQQIGRTRMIIDARMGITLPGAVDANVSIKRDIFLKARTLI
jgi:hypothetical protein